MTDVAKNQVPDPGKINLDHVAHFVPHMDSASAALERLGFTLTPFSAQSHRIEPGGPLISAGTGNRCVMLKSGYLEFLTPTGSTPHAGQLRAAIRRYIGVHMIAFGTATPDLDRARLARAGFNPLPTVALQRNVGTEAGADIVRFTVVRVPPGTMAEGRIQYCRHDTPHLVWQPRWLEHANGARALTGVLVCVEDAQQAAQRYARFTGLLPQVSGGVWRIDTARGFLLFFESERCERNFGVKPPALPWIVGYTLACDRPAATRSQLIQAGREPCDLDGDRFFVTLPAELGGLVVFEPSRATALKLG